MAEQEPLVGSCPARIPAECCEQGSSSPFQKTREQKEGSSPLGRSLRGPSAGSILTSMDQPLSHGEHVPWGRDWALGPPHVRQAGVAVGRESRACCFPSDEDSSLECLQGKGPAGRIPGEKALQSQIWDSGTLEFQALDAQDPGLSQWLREGLGPVSLLDSELTRAGKPMSVMLRTPSGLGGSWNLAGSAGICQMNEWSFPP